MASPYSQYKIKICKVLKEKLMQTATSYNHSLNKYSLYSAYYVKEHSTDPGFIESFYKSVGDYTRKSNKIVKDIRKMDDEYLIRISRLMKALLNDVAAGYGLTLNQFTNIAAWYCKSHSNDEAFRKRFQETEALYRFEDDMMLTTYEANRVNVEKGLCYPYEDHILEELEKAEKAGDA